MTDTFDRGWPDEIAGGQVREYSRTYQLDVRTGDYTPAGWEPAYQNYFKL